MTKRSQSLKMSNFLSKFLFYAGNIIIGLIFVSPLVWMISASLKPETKIFANMNSLMTFFPVDASLANYQEVFSRLDMGRVFGNTLLYIGLMSLALYDSLLRPAGQLPVRLCAGKV